MLVRIWRNLNPCTLLVGMKNGTAAVENSMSVLQKKKVHRITIWFRNCPPGYIPKRIQSRHANRYLYIIIHSSIVHNSQKMEATQVSVDGWRDKQNVTYIGNGIVCSCEKEWSSDTCYNMDDHYKKFWWCLYNIVNVINITEVHLNGYNGNFILYILTHF